VKRQPAPLFPQILDPGHGLMTEINMYSHNFSIPPDYMVISFNVQLGEPGIRFKRQSVLSGTSCITCDEIRYTRHPFRRTMIRRFKWKHKPNIISWTRCNKDDQRLNSVIDAIYMFSIIDAICTFTDPLPHMSPLSNACQDGASCNKCPLHNQSPGLGHSKPHWTHKGYSRPPSTVQPEPRTGPFKTILDTQGLQSPASPLPVFFNLPLISTWQSLYSTKLQLQIKKSSYSLLSKMQTRRPYPDFRPHTPPLLPTAFATLAPKAQTWNFRKAETSERSHRRVCQPMSRSPKHQVCCMGSFVHACRSRKFPVSARCLVVVLYGWLVP
jgi:hypothetical protein